MGTIHGDSAREAERLSGQAAILRPPPPLPGRQPGCGSGRQSLALLEHDPGTHPICLDVDTGQLDLGRERLAGWERSLASSMAI